MVEVVAALDLVTTDKEVRLLVGVVDFVVGRLLRLIGTLNY